MKNGIVHLGQGQQLALHTPARKTDLDQDLLKKLAGFQPLGKVYGAETSAAHEFLGVVEDYVAMLATSGHLQRLKTPAEIANVLSSQIPVQQALAKLLFKRATGVKGGTAVVIFNILETDLVAPILRALIQDNAFKVLKDDIAPGGQLPKFEVAFEAKVKAEPPAGQVAALPATAGTPGKA